jgi:uncharacterized protein YybS (DUF2232 family)
MGQQPTPAPTESAFNRSVPWLLCVLLIGNFLWRALTEAHEYPVRTSQVLEMVVDGACVIGLIGLRAKLPTALFLIALIAGIGLFAIRLHSDASWWTGHWSYSLSRR